MKDYFPQGAKTFDYAAFIEELRPLVDQARALEDDDCVHDSAAFRAWKLRLANLLLRTRRIPRSVDTNFDSRMFRAMNTMASDAENSFRFERDLEDTTAELDLVIEIFDKYGDPNKTKELAKPQTAPLVAVQPALPTLGLPEKITTRWVLDHVPAAWLWGGVVSCLLIVGTAFSLGLTAAGTKAGKSVLEWFTPADPKKP